MNVELKDVFGEVLEILLLFSFSDRELCKFEHDLDVFRKMANKNENIY